MGICYYGKISRQKGKRERKNHGVPNGTPWLIFWESSSLASSAFCGACLVAGNDRVGNICNHTQGDNCGCCVDQDQADHIQLLVAKLQNTGGEVSVDGDVAPESADDIGQDLDQAGTEGDIGVKGVGEIHTVDDHNDAADGEGQNQAHSVVIYVVVIDKGFEEILAHILGVHPAVVLQGEHRLGNVTLSVGLDHIRKIKIGQKHNGDLCQYQQNDHNAQYANGIFHR